MMSWVLIFISRTAFSLDPKAWFPPMRLTYSHVYSYENKYNLIGRNASNNLKKKLDYWDHTEPATQRCS